MDNLPTFSPTQFEVYDRCPQAHHYAYVEELSRKRPDAPHFDFGNYSHELLHVYYQLLKLGTAKPGSDFIIKAMESRVKNDLGKENIEILAKVWPRLLTWLTNQSPQIDAGIEVVEVEYEFHVEDRTPKGRSILYHGIIDLLYRDKAGVLRIRDHKTGANPKTHTSDTIKLNPQLLHYAAALDVPDVEINFLNSYIHKTKVPTVNELFKIIRYQHTPVGLAVARDNMLQKIDKILDNQPHKNYSTACTHCQFFDICHLESRGLSTATLIRTTYEKGKRSARIQVRDATTGEEHSGGNEGFTISIPNF